VLYVESLEFDAVYHVYYRACAQDFFIDNELIALLFETDFGVLVDINGLASFYKPPGVLSHPNQPCDKARSLIIGSAIRFAQQSACICFLICLF
jgi:hypothetical protein